ncbi:uncharacterized protein LOC110452674 [Mizuhopecten yessoensis]|nr:uncharacterized protein LOC110452674 [Mizuhopecten yessoensis]
MEDQEGTTCGTEEEKNANEGKVQPISGQKKKHTHHSYLYCTWCYELVTDVKRHMLQRCKERMNHLQGNDQDKEIYESAIDEERKTIKNFLFNMCISPDEFEDRSYSKNELLELFMEYGHIVVPERFAATFKPPQRFRSSLATGLFPTACSREIQTSFTNGNDKNEPPAASNSHTSSRRKEPSGQEASRTKPDPTTRSNTPSKRSRRNIDTSDDMISSIEEPEQATKSYTPSKRSKRHTDTSTDEMGTDQEDNEEQQIKTISTNIIQRLRYSNNGTLMKTEVPAKEDVLDKFHVSGEAAVKIIRRIRYFKQKDELLEIAHGVIARESQKKHKKISDLQTPSINVQDPKFKSIVTKVCGEKKGGKKTEKDRIIDRKNKKTITILMDEIINKERSKAKTMTDQEIMQHLYKQDWPHCKKAYHSVKGKIVCNGLHSIPAGTIVCDYHGNHITHTQGEQRLRSIEKDEDAKHMLFYRHPVNGKRMCVDAATIPCLCHLGMKSGTMSRLISHSATAPNLKAVARVIGGHPCVLLIATEVIKNSAEFLFDYGVRPSPTGEKISWLQK